MKKYLFLFFSVFLLSIISANGLTITSQKNFDINLTSGENKTINFTIKNEEPFQFSFITFESNNFISMIPFNLTSGESKNITATIFSTDDFDGSIEIKGQYVANVGEQNELHQLLVDYDSGTISPDCDFSIIKGDDVQWDNGLEISTGSIKLINADTGVEVVTISPNSTHTQDFPIPQIFKYYFTRFGFIFTPQCEITVLDTQGFISNPELNTELILNIDVAFKPTVISVNSFTTKYSLQHGESQQDIIQITNIGSEIAKNVTLSGDWFFLISPNNFDLSPGQSRNIGYTITPFVSFTNDTNKSYNKNLTITGNFADTNKQFEVFVEFTTVNPNNNNNSNQTFREILRNNAELIEAYCNENPTDEICDFIDNSFNSNGGLNNETFTAKQMQDFIRGFLEFADNQNRENSLIKEQNAKISENLTAINLNYNNLTADLSNLEQEQSSSNEIAYYALIVFLTVILISLGIYLIYNEHHKKQREQYN